MTRPRMMMLALAVVVAAAAVVWFVRRPFPPQISSTASPPAPPPAQSPAAGSPFAPGEEQSQRQLVHDIITQGLTPIRAAWYFSMELGPLPGVDVPASVTRDPSDWDASAAVMDVYSVWDSLTTAQRQAVDRVVRGPNPASAPHAALRGQSRFELTPVVYTPVRLNESGFDYDGAAKTASERLSTYLNRPVLTKYYVDVVDETPPGAGWAETDTFLVNGGRNHEGCHLKFWDKVVGKWGPAVATSVVTHEMYHCYQDAEVTDFGQRKSIRPWINEGAADWVMVTVVPEAPSVIQHHWTPYIDTPGTKFSDRGYDGVGVFGHLSDIIGENATWPMLLESFKAAIGGKDVPALNTLIQGHRDKYLSSWASSYFRTASIPWNMLGPGSPQERGPDPEEITVGDGEFLLLPAADPYTARLFGITSAPDLLSVSLLRGYARLHDSGFGIDTQLVHSAPLALCLKPGACACPDGSAGASQLTKPARLPLSIGLEGGEVLGQIVVAGKSLDDFCDKPEDPRMFPFPPPGGGGGGDGQEEERKSKPNDPGETANDPHVRTFDGSLFDFQRVGEYTLVRSTKDDFVVQVRQVPVGHSRAASVNQAMATRIGGHRVTVTLENGQSVLRLDGTPVSGDPPALEGGSITRALTSYGAAYTFEWPDGTIAHADQVGPFGISVQVSPSAVRRGSLEGLLGNADGKPENDEQSGAALAGKWLIAGNGSFFDYAPGQSPQTFVDPSFPDPNAAVPNREAAERDCREEGITDPRLLHDCVIDLGITNGFFFKGLYAHQQAVLASRAALMRPAATLPGARVLLMAGAITDVHATPELRLQADAGDVIYVSPTPDCVDRAKDWGEKPESVIFLTLFDPAGQMIEGHPGCEMGRYAFPAPGSYTLRANVGRNQLGAYHVPIRFVRHDRVTPVAYGAIVSGTIEMPGAHDVYTFTAKAGDIIQIAGEGCSLGNLLLSVVYPDGSDVLGPMCRDGAVTPLHADGQYRLVVNGDNRGSGAYQFVFQGVSGR